MLQLSLRSSRVGNGRAWEEQTWLLLCIGCSFIVFLPEMWLEMRSSSWHNRDLSLVLAIYTKAFVTSVWFRWSLFHLLQNMIHCSPVLCIPLMSPMLTNFSAPHSHSSPMGTRLEWQEVANNTQHTPYLSGKQQKKFLVAWQINPRSFVFGILCL